MFVGLTGAMGAGKSALAQLLGELGAVVINADQVGHGVIETPPVRDALFAAFGPSIIGADQRLDRKQLGRLAFADAERLQLLNTLVRPALEQAIWQQAAAVKDTQKGGLLILDAPLIFEWDMAQRFDLVIVVHTQEAIRLARLEKRGLTPAEIQRRMAGQLSPKEKRQRADIVVLNNGDIESLRHKAQALWARLLKMQKAKQAD